MGDCPSLFPHYPFFYKRKEPPCLYCFPSLLPPDTIVGERIRKARRTGRQTAWEGVTLPHRPFLEILRTFSDKLGRSNGSIPKKFALSLGMYLGLIGKEQDVNRERSFFIIISPSSTHPSTDFIASLSSLWDQ